MVYFVFGSFHLLFGTVYLGIWEGVLPRYFQSVLGWKSKSPVPKIHRNIYLWIKGPEVTDWKRRYLRWSVQFLFHLFQRATVVSLFQCSPAKVFGEVEKFFHELNNFSHLFWRPRFWCSKQYSCLWWSLYAHNDSLDWIETNLPLQNFSCTQKLKCVKTFYFAMPTRLPWSQSEF